MGHIWDDAFESEFVFEDEEELGDFLEKIDLKQLGNYGFGLY